MVSPIVEELRKLDVHPVVLTEASKTNRHERRKLDRQARSYRQFAKRKPVDWLAKRRAARIRVAESRKRNR